MRGYEWCKYENDSTEVLDVRLRRSHFAEETETRIRAAVFVDERRAVTGAVMWAATRVVVALGIARVEEERPGTDRS